MTKFVHYTLFYQDKNWHKFYSNINNYFNHINILDGINHV
jgi:hypothetical protein